MKKSVFILLFFLCVLSCERNSSDEVINISNIDIGNHEFLDSRFKLKSFFPLETNSICLIGKIDKSIITDNLIFILDRDIKKAILVFNLDGKFLYSISNKGHGAGEFIYLTDFDVNEDNGILFLLDAGLRKVIFFDYRNGSFLNEFKVNKIYSSIKSSNEFIALASTTSKNNVIYVFDYNGKLLYNEIKNYYPKGNINNGVHLINNDDNTIIVSVPFDNNIYLVEKNKTDKLYSFKYSDWIKSELLNYSFDKLRKELTNKKHSKTIYEVELLISTEKSLISKVNYERITLLMVTDFKTLESDYIFPMPKTNPFKGDLVGSNDQKLIFASEPMVVKKMLSRNKEHYLKCNTGMNFEDINSLGKNSNPIISIYEEK